MTQSNLSREDTNIFDLNSSVYWAISTFGAIEFQLKKILNSLELLKTLQVRMPNEIMIITHGRKKQVLLDIMKEGAIIKWTYVDDSEHQLTAISDENVIVKLIKANRAGAKRFGEPSRFEVADMSEPLSSLVT